VIRFNRLSKLGLVLFSVSLSVVIAEVFLRLIDYNYTPLSIQVINNNSEWRYYHSFQDEHFVYDPYLIWRPKKGVFVFNSQGYRGKEISVDKKPGEFRIFAIGDSNTLGWVGDDGANWPAYLQELLAQKDQRFIVLNAGVYGYSSFQGLRYFKEILAFQPYMVLISFGWNDALQVTESDARFDSRRIKLLSLYKLLHKYRVGQLLIAFSDKFFSKQKSHLVPRVSLQEYKDNITEITRLSKERKIKVIFLTRPCTNGWCRKNPYNAATKEIAKYNSITVIDIYSYFEDKKEYFVDQSHFNKAGHQFAAGIIYNSIMPLLYD
jgi:lysophospholipase L1-like esterase